MINVDIKTTIGSQAIDIFRNHFLDCQLERTRLDYEGIFREYFYSGGRVEVYKGRGNVSVFDVNSLYPFVMRNPMPCGKCSFVKSYQRGKIGFYKVHVAAMPDFYISPFLVKHALKKKNFFVTGPGDYFLSSATIEYLRSEYSIRFSVEFGIVFDSQETIFREYVDTFYKMKQENDGNAKHLIAKYMLNTLYGKLGQSRWKDSLEVYDGTQQNFATFDENYGLVLVSKESKSKFIQPHLACYITELARLYHFRLMQLDLQNVYYCDTDSIFVESSSKKYDSLVGPEIGKLKCEGKFDALFLAPKTYALRESDGTEYITFKGFDASGFTFKQFRSAMRNGTQLTQTKERILSFRECLAAERQKVNGSRRKGLKEERGQFLKLVVMTKKVESVYDKRYSIPDKKYLFDTRPFSYADVMEN